MWNVDKEFINIRQVSKLLLINIILLIPFKEILYPFYIEKSYSFFLMYKLKR